MTQRIEHKKNTAYYLSFPMVDSTTPADFRTGETVTDTAYYKDGSGSWTSLAIADTVSEIGSTGIYEIDLTAAELNHDQVIIKFTATNSRDHFVYIDLTLNDINDLGQYYAVICHLIESHRGAHSFQAAIGNAFFVDPVNGDTHANGARGTFRDPYNSVQDCHDNAVTDSQHDIIFLTSGQPSGVTTLTEDISLSKRYLQVRGPGRDFIVTRSDNGDTITVSADGVGIEGCQVNTHTSGSGAGISASGTDFFKAEHVWVNDTRGDGINISNTTNAIVRASVFTDTGQSGAGDGVQITATSGNSSSYALIEDNIFQNVQGDAVLISPSGSGTINDTKVQNNIIFGSTGSAVNVSTGANDTVISDNRFAANSTDITDNGTNTTAIFNTEVSASTADIADAVWDEATAGHVAAGSFGLLAADTKTATDSNTSAIATVDTVVDGIKAVTDNLPDSGALSSLAQGSNLATVDSNVDAILVDTGTTIPAQITALNDVGINEILYTQLTETYAADATAPTLAQAIFMIQQMLGDFTITGTTMTVKQTDGTTAATFTLNDATNPTGITRS